MPFHFWAKLQESNFLLTKTLTNLLFSPVKWSFFFPFFSAFLGRFLWFFLLELMVERSDDEHDLIFKQVVMSNFKMITYRQEGVYKGPHFFILNKGLNSGKPLKKPCPNCFVISCHTNWSFESRIRIWIIFCSNDQKNLSIAIATVIFLLWNGSGKETNYMWYLEELLVFLRKVKKKVCTG